MSKISQWLGKTTADDIGKAGLAAFVGGKSTAGINAYQARQEVLQLPEDVLAESERYQELLQTMTPEDARNQLAEEIGRKTAAYTFLLGAMSGLGLFGPMKFSGGWIMQGLKKAGTSLVTEGTTEAAE